MGAFYDANYTVTKIRTSGGDIVELELNNKPVALTAELFCFKHSSSYLYTKAIPAEDKDGVTVYTGGAITKTTANYNVERKTDCWTYDNKYFAADTSELEGAPDGSMTFNMRIGDFIWATNKKFYKRVTAEDESNTYYEVLAFGKTEATVSTTAVSDATLIAELEELTPARTNYAQYTLTTGFTYSDNHYERYATGDVTIE